MLLHLARIETCGPDGRARRIVFGDDREPRKTAGAVVKALGLEEGSDHDADSFFAELESTEERCAKDRAVGLLGYRERSSRELERRLTDDGYPPGLCRRLVARYAELELVDDERFASMWARSRAAAGHGPDRVSRELALKGVTPAAASAAVEEAFGDEDIVARARESLRGKRPETRKERERLIRRLVTRGYSLGVAIAALEDPDDG